MVFKYSIVFWVVSFSLPSLWPDCSLCPPVSRRCRVYLGSLLPDSGAGSFFVCALRIIFRYVLPYDPVFCPLCFPPCPCSVFALLLDFWIFFVFALY
uniref:Uncharacterized protein n=1 Tax=Anguilla anguilla TaxID=7936 RepID=A0A0E9WEZ5_ANGAN